MHLIGGGWQPEAVAAVYGAFLEEAGRRGSGGDGPVVACVLVEEGDGGAAAEFERYDSVLRSVAPCRPVPVVVPVGGVFDPGALRDADALLVGGGLTPAFQEAFGPVRDEVRELVRTRGLPYAGFSAGAALAAESALVGGWLSKGVPVCPGDAAEDLEEVEVRDGLGLLPATVDVHATQWGTLGRLIEVVRSGGAPQGVAIDEGTALVVEDGHGTVAGTGRVHLVRPAIASSEGTVTVRAYGTGETFAF
ncbi:Type 1 glutamine amidotransferase-like domain-containing protein [Streptomyces sp. NPDC047000]|uniref:Type 1 glutamine amidotransferase-like domain-containing protein n=1 Tax=Streptomyces sp. NPDC047000 TaxID=3155474 RepID=UPI0033DD4C07